MNAIETQPQQRPRSLWRKHYAIPAAHGSWSWWIGPVLIGMAAGGAPRWTFLSLVVAALAAFLMHQPVTIAVKAWAGRRPRHDLRPALTWVALYAVVGGLAVACLVANGYVKVLALAVPGVVVFGWFLLLVARRSERRQMLVEILGAGTMALGAPAAYWVSGGADYPEPWVLWALTWLQSASAIANVYLRLEQRRWTSIPPVPARAAAGRVSLLWHVAGLAGAIAAAAIGQVPPLVPVAFGWTLLDALDSTARPMVGARPSRIGVRQLLVGSIFVALFAAAYL